MNDLIRDIEILESAIIAFTEGASDEKLMSLNSLEGLIAEKKSIIKSLNNSYYTPFNFGSPGQIRTDNITVMSGRFYR